MIINILEERHINLGNNKIRSLHHTAQQELVKEKVEKASDTKSETSGTSYTGKLATPCHSSA
jgi:hypothetical protein